MIRKHCQGWSITCLDRGSEEKILGTRGARKRAHQLGVAGWGKEEVVEGKYRERNTWTLVLPCPLQMHKKTLLFWNIFKIIGAKSRDRETNPTVPLLYEGALEKSVSQPSADETAAGHTEKYSKN